MADLGKETILGRLRDEGFSAVLVNRVEELLAAFGDNIPQFCALTKGRLAGAYNTLHPEGERGMGAQTWKTFERFCAIWRELQCDARATAKAVVEEQERREAERASMRNELLDGVVDFDALTTAMAALGTLGLKSCELGKLLEMHAMALKARGGTQ